MKNKTWITHKIGIIFYALLIAIIFCGCEHPAGQRESKDGYSIIGIDSCEYIEVSSMIGTDQGYYSLTHKGNCKYCTQRSKK